MRTGDEGKEEGKRKKQVHQATHCCLKLKPAGGYEYTREERNVIERKEGAKDGGAGAGDNAGRGALRRRRLGGKTDLNEPDYKCGGICVVTPHHTEGGV